LPGRAVRRIAAVPSVAPGKHVRMLVYLLNPTISDQPKYIREGRCMQKAASWATVWPPITLASMGAIARKYGDARVIDGNVEEWTLDWYKDGYYRESPSIDPQGPAVGFVKAVRGGSWKSSLAYGELRVDQRTGYLVGGRFNTVGFRCVRRPH
jgi:hypothetical protein